MISGLSHITFAVSNLDRSLVFYADWLGLTRMVRWDEGAYLQAGEVWIALIVDRAAPEATNNSSYTHIALQVDPARFAALRDRLLARDVEEWQDNASPGASFYFLDPDGHKLEIHAATLQDRLAWLKQNPKPGLVWLNSR